MFMPGVWILWSKKEIVIILQKENGNTFTLLIIFIVKSLQKEQNSTNLLLWPPICRNKPAITPKWFNSLDTNSTLSHQSFKSIVFYFQLLLLCTEYGWQYESEKSPIYVCGPVWLRKVWVRHIGEIFHHSSEKLSPCGLSQLDARISRGKFNLLHLKELSWNIQTFGGRSSPHIFTKNEFQIFNRSWRISTIPNTTKFFWSFSNLDSNLLCSFWVVSRRKIKIWIWGKKSSVYY